MSWEISNLYLMMLPHCVSPTAYIDKMVDVHIVAYSSVSMMMGSGSFQS